jgi:hypothetical protein
MTTEPLLLSDCSITLQPFTDGEAEFRVEARGIDVKYGRISAVFLLVLAEARLSGDGWVECRELGAGTGVGERAVDVYLARLRQLFLRFGFENAHMLVEGRPRYRRLTIDPSRIRIAPAVEPPDPRPAGA